MKRFAKNDGVRDETVKDRLMKENSINKINNTAKLPYRNYSNRSN